MESIPGPLAGLHVLDLSSFVAGPSCTMHLALLGAEVVRIDPAAGPADIGRHPLAADGSSLYWAGLNKGKRVVRADLRDAAVRDTVRGLLARPGEGHGLVVTNAIGQDWLAYRELTSARDDLIMIHIEGRSDGASAVDYTINPETGLPDLTGPRVLADPVGSLLPSWDLLAGLHGALALVSAVRQRERTGKGAYVRISLADVAASTMAHLGYIGDALLNRTERRRDGNSLYGSYGQDFALVDGRRIMVTAITSRHWQGLVSATGTAEPIAALERHTGADFGIEGERYAHRAAITGLLEPWFAARSHAEATAALDAARVPWGEFKTVLDMAASPDGLVARSAIFDTLTHPGGTYAVPRTVSRSAGWGAVPSPGYEPTGLDDVAALWGAGR